MNVVSKTQLHTKGLGMAVLVIALAGCAAQPVPVASTETATESPVLSNPIETFKEKFESIMFPDRINFIRMAATNFAMKAQMERNRLNDVLAGADKVKGFIGEFNSCMAPQSEMVEQQFKRLKDHFKDQSKESIAMFDPDAIKRFMEKIAAIRSGNGLFDIHHLIPDKSSLDDAMAGNREPRIRMLLSGLRDDAAQSPLLLVNDYVKAYFGSVESVIVNLDSSDSSGWAKGIAEALQRRADSPTVEKLTDQLTGELTTDPALRQELKQFLVPIPMQEPGFVSRDGTRYQFPAISLKGDKAVIDESQVGADVVRLNMEAIRDAFAPLPVVPNATVVKSKPMRKLSGIELFNPESAQWNVTAKDFMIIQGDANAVESAVASAVGRAIRGGSWGSLNNEALAKAIETAAGVFARHTLERSEWCIHKVKGKEMKQAMASNP